VDGDVEIIVVDSGSTDDTVAIAREKATHVIEIPSEGFNRGAALNTGCEAASAPILFALSAHAFPRDENWLAGSLAYFEDPRVACVYGCDNAAEGGPLHGHVVQDVEYARRYPYWGYSNVSGGFRADLWRERPFRADMSGTEDREWAYYWLERGYVCIIDCELRVEHKHDFDSFRDRHRRAVREWHGYTQYMDLPPYGVRELLHEWWFERQGWPNHFRARLSRRRIAELTGKFAAMAATRRAS
jgi:rhamnosyltransferase